MWCLFLLQLYVMFVSFTIICDVCLFYNYMWCLLLLQLYVMFVYFTIICDVCFFYNYMWCLFLLHLLKWIQTTGPARSRGVVQLVWKTRTLFNVLARLEYRDWCVKMVLSISLTLQLGNFPSDEIFLYIHYMCSKAEAMFWVFLNYDHSMLGEHFLARHIVLCKTSRFMWFYAKHVVLWYIWKHPLLLCVCVCVFKRNNYTQS